MHAMCFCLLLTLPVSACLAMDAKPVRLSEAVGDVVDATERAKYALFPDVPGFRSARFAVAPDSAFYAIVETDSPAAACRILYRLSATQFDRVRFLVENSHHVHILTTGNRYASMAVQHFWDEIEKPVPSDRLAQFEMGPDTGSSGVEWLDRRTTTFYGATLGSGVGGYLATRLAVTKVAPGYYWTDWTRCSDRGCAEPMTTWIPAKFNVNWPVYCGVYGGATVLGAAAGSRIGHPGDSREPFGASAGGWKWMACLTAVPGTILSILFVSWANGYLYGQAESNRYRVGGEDGNFLLAVPAYITGLCILADFALLGYKLGQTFDRRSAARRRDASYAGHARRPPAESALAMDSSLPGSPSSIDSLAATSDIPDEHLEPDGISVRPVDK